MAGDAGADAEVGATSDEKLSDFGVHAFKMSQGVEDWRLSPNAVDVDIGAGVDVGASIE